MKRWNDAMIWSLTLGLLLSACGSDSNTENPADTRLDSGVPGDDVGIAVDATPDTSSTSNLLDSDNDRGPQVDSAGGHGDTVPPTEAEELFAWLAAGEYAAFSAESGIFDSGIHTRQRTFLNPELVASLEAGNATHPVGSATVKELYPRDSDALLGWAVSVKISEGTDGDSWYWYEIFSTTDSSSPVADGPGESLCTGCHGSGGSDFVQIPFPLR